MNHDKSRVSECIDGELAVARCPATADCQHTRTEDWHVIARAYPRSPCPLVSSTWIVGPFILTHPCRSGELTLVAP